MQYTRAYLRMPPIFSEACGANLHQNQAGSCSMDASPRSQGQAEVNSSVQAASPPWAFLAQIRPKVRLLAVGFNGKIRKGTPFSSHSACQASVALPCQRAPGAWEGLWGRGSTGGRPGEGPVRACGGLEKAKGPGRDVALVAPHLGPCRHGHRFLIICI